ncbi:MAG: LysR family transcriptional regulator, partial [Anaerococcus sp.]|nr:LysR family transcriptional regulator [Anaerococcus sp.]
MLDFRIESFLEVCKYMNFTRAAESLNITQPAISTHIKYLETYYNCKLFYRSKRNLCLTYEGKILKSALLSMSNDQDKLKMILTEKKTKSEKISLGFTRSVGEYLILDKLIALIKEKPSCDFHIYYENTDEILSDIDS